MQEFRALVLELGREITPEDTREIFNLIDTDKSGTIDFQEFYSWWTNRKSSSSKDSKFWTTLFKFADKLVENPAKAPIAPSAAAAASADMERAGTPPLRRSMGAMTLPWVRVEQFSPGWKAPEAPLQAASLCVIEGSGTILLRGCAVGETAGQMFVLPPNARPVAVEKFACLKSSSKKSRVTVVTISPDGVVNSSDAGEIWLSSISFSRAV